MLAISPLLICHSDEFKVRLYKYWWSMYCTWGQKRCASFYAWWWFSGGRKRHRQFSVIPHQSCNLHALFLNLQRICKSTLTINFHCLFFSRRWAVFSFCWKLWMHFRRRLIENTTTTMSHKNCWDVFWYKTLMNVLSHVMILDEETSGPSEQI